MTDRLRYNLDATDAAEIRFLVDAETLGWLEMESARTGISLEKIASAMLRKACNETPALGAPGATVSAGCAETAEVRCDARRRSVRHFFMEIDGMTVTYGDIVEEQLCDTVPYYVERDDGEGDFDFAQGSLPTCTPVKSKGFSESELWDIESLMRDNMHNIYDQIRGEGAWE